MSRPAETQKVGVCWEVVNKWRAGAQGSRSGDRMRQIGWKGGWGGCDIKLCGGVAGAER